MTTYYEQTDFLTFKKIQENWKRIGISNFRCEKHQTVFNPDKEPCWQCLSECKVKVDEEEWLKRNVENKTKENSLK